MITGRSRWFWIWTNAVNVTAFSLIAAAITHNPHWPLNIPIGLVGGALWGWCAYAISRRLERRRARHDAHVRQMLREIQERWVR